MADKDTDINKLLAKRKKNKERIKKLADRKKEGKTTFLGKFKRKRAEKKKKKIQDKINKNPTAQSWRNKKAKNEKIKKMEPLPPINKPLSPMKREKRRKFHPPLKKKTGGFRDTFLEPPTEQI